MENTVHPARASLNILTKATEMYLTNLDDLARALALPQVQQAAQILDQLVKQAEEVNGTQE